jgi:hypothetical protein
MADDELFAAPVKQPDLSRNVSQPPNGTAGTGTNYISNAGNSINANSSNTTSIVSGAPKVDVSNPAPIKAPLESSKAFSLEEANEEVAQLLTSGKVTQKEVSSLQGMMRDHAALKEKVNKLKSLLGRSAKAQREAKMELEGTTKKLENALKEIERLTTKLEKLSNRPTHMDLLADFETNFDKALLSVGVGSSNAVQTGGETTSAAIPTSTLAPSHDAVVDGMLLQELAESQSRIERLEQLNTALLHRSSQLEQQSKALQYERNTALAQVDRMSLELRMAQMEAENASRSVQDKIQSLQEMQLEIDLVTKASMDANVRAIRGEEAAKAVQTDREMVKQLQAQVQALQEWALASAEAKRLTQERSKLLEEKLRAYESIDKKGSIEISSGGVVGSRTSLPSCERVLTTKSSSMVIGAGDVGFVVMELGDCAQQLQSGERFILRWKFDVTPSELGISLHLMKGRCDDVSKRFRADYFVKDR